MHKSGSFQLGKTCCNLWRTGTVNVKQEPKSVLKIAELRLADQPHPHRVDRQNAGPAKAVRPKHGHPLQPASERSSKSCGSGFTRAGASWAKPGYPSALNSARNRSSNSCRGCRLTVCPPVVPALMSRLLSASVRGLAPFSSRELKKGRQPRGYLPFFQFQRIPTPSRR